VESTFTSACSTSAALLLGHRPRRVIGHIWSSRRAFRPLISVRAWVCSAMFAQKRRGGHGLCHRRLHIRCRRILDDLYAWVRLKL
jgi:hypothetical protein